jgi:hypothetical protein
MANYYRQCKIQKQNSYQTSYLPEKFAVKGKMVKLRDNDVWDDGWQVIEVSSFCRSEESLPDYHSDIKRHRKATGDSQRK